jgi:hypothetical protein
MRATTGGGRKQLADLSEGDALSGRMHSNFTELRLSARKTAEVLNANGIPAPEGGQWYATAKEVSREMTDETAHLIKEYRVNAARMRAQANSVRSPAKREQFEQIARKLDHLADYLVSRARYVRES